jgi:hypothetical protein
LTWCTIPQELVPLHIPFELEHRVDLESIRRVERIDLHRMIDHEVGLHLGVDLRRCRLVTRHANDRCTHRCEVNDCRDTGEVLEHHTGRFVGDLLCTDL